MEAFHGMASSLLVGDPARGIACTDDLENEAPICPDVPFFLSSDVSPDAFALAAVDKRASASGIRGRSTGECIEDSSIERAECRRNAGFSLPRFCREKNAQQEAGKRFGFVVSRRRRTLSLDDQSVLIKDTSAPDSRDSKMKMMTSRDDSCLPFMADCSIAQLKKELMSATTLTKRGSSGLSAERSMSFACHRGESHLHCREKQQHEESCYDLVGSPGPKFLLNVTLAEAFESPLTPFKTAAAVPFKWEVAPGKPKPEAAAPKPERSLQLPPRLLVRSFTAKHAEQQSSILSPDRQRQQRRAQSVNHRHGGLLQLGIIRSSAESPRHKSSEAEKHHDPSSPTSILCGPESGSTSSSSDTLSVSDSECHQRAPVDPSSVSDAESATLNQQQRSPPPSQEEVSSSCALGPAAKSSSLTDSIAKIFHLGRAKWAKKKTKNHHEEVQMWAPTLAAYFHSSNLGGDSGQLVLLEDSNSDSVVASESAASSGESSVRSNGLRVESDEGGSGEEGYCGCSSPRFAPFSPSSQLRSLKRGSGKQKKWVVRRIRRSSRLFQTFVFKAVKHAVQPRRKSPLDSSKLLYHSVQS